MQPELFVFLVVKKVKSYIGKNLLGFSEGGALLGPKMVLNGFGL